MPHQQEADSLPERVGRIGIDGEGRFHYLHGPANIRQVVYIVDDGTVTETFDLNGDIPVSSVEGWIEHVQDKAEWKRLDYEMSMVDQLIWGLSE